MDSTDTTSANGPKSKMAIGVAPAEIRTENPPNMVGCTDKHRLGCAIMGIKAGSTYYYQIYREVSRYAQQAKSYQRPQGTKQWYESYL